ncbi:MAG: phosphopantothenoylcysteine decarboxylase [Ardenticatenia bacterium]|nr:phosphopantothenoylcysteine decarboxylase [Ardenticatenia bacterium]
MRLLPNPDILEAVKQKKPPGLMVVGWAAETHDLIENARSKLERKELDIIVANPVPQTFGSGRVQATLLFRDGTIVPLEPLSKVALANRLLDLVAEHLRRARRGRAST